MVVFVLEMKLCAEISDVPQPNGKEMCDLDGRLARRITAVLNIHYHVF